MKWRDLAWPGLALLAGAGLWLLFGKMGNGQSWGIDHGLPGAVLLLAAAWTALWVGASREQRATGEWIAWTGLCVSVIGLSYFGLRWPELMATGTGVHARWVMGNLMLLLLGWALLLQGWAGHWASPVDPSARPWTQWHEHPHGAQIERQAAEFGRMALTFGVICLALLFGFLPEARLHWVRPFLVANLLLFVLMWGWLVEYAATVWLYRQYRRLRQPPMEPPA